MPRVNYRELEFTHFVVINSERGIFGCARENGGKVHIYLIGYDAPWVKQRYNDDWCELQSADAEAVRQRVQCAYDEHKPVYRTDRVTF